MLIRDMETCLFSYSEPTIEAKQPRLRQVRAHLPPSAPGLAWPGLAALLERVFPVQFAVGASKSGLEEEILTVSESETRQDEGGSNGGATRLLLPSSGHKTRSDGLKDITIRFSDHPSVPFPFRGRSVCSKVTSEPVILPLSRAEMPLASCEQGAVWTVVEQGGTKHFRSGFAVPEVGAGEDLKDVVKGERFLEMLPLLHWLGEVSGSAPVKGPPLRACFIFDDPNLHSRRYGFVDFQEVAAHAARENYHVTFATIPLDAWFASSVAARIFQTNVKRLSLCVHGNDHLRHELARDYSKTERNRLLRQAIRRIERLERNAGVQVCRVMVPPHGALSEAMLSELPACGFEGACVSHGSLGFYNRTQPWTRHLGLKPSEWVQGCPVLPRWGLSSATINTVLLAAFLRQPFVLCGHHQDLRHGVEVLDKLAGLINGLGDVAWSNLSGLCRMNYRWQMEGRTCRIFPLARKILFPVPDSATHLLIEASQNEGQENWQVSGQSDVLRHVRTGEGFPVESGSGRKISVVAGSEAEVPFANGKGRPAAFALFRRLLTESRDRFFA
jgi:hypothetical protein